MFPFDMGSAELWLVVIGIAFVVVRVVLVLTGRAAKRDGTTYPEPNLQLEDEADEAHDVFGELASTLDADRAADARYLEATEAAPTRAAFPVAVKVVLTGVSVAALVAIPYVVPAVAFLRVTGAPVEAVEEAPIAAGGPLPSASIGVAKLPGETFDQQARAKELDAPTPDSRGPIAAHADTPKIAAAVKEDKPPRSIEDPSGKALDALFAKLARIEAGEKEVVRILYFGDSIVASDFVSGKLRRLMQDRFGDAGHGYAIIANAWPGWFHIDVSRRASGEWLVSTCVGPYAEDGLYGLGCASFMTPHKGIWAEIGTAELHKWGRSVSSFELEYLQQPGGGAVDLMVDGKLAKTVATDGEKQVAYAKVEVPDGPHRLKIVTADKDPVRLFGVRMERDVPGVTFSAMGITGARARFLDKQDDEHFAAVLKAAKPDLVCLAFGSNEVTDGQMYSMEDYRETLGAVMEQIEKAVPDSSLMLVGPPDMASKNSAWGHSRPMVPIIGEEQRQLAAKRGWAFWDQNKAMGGTGSMWAWIQAGLGSKDMFHPTGQGGNQLGTWQYLALMESFEAYKDAHR